MENNNNLELLKAKKRMKRIKGFYSHLVTFIMVNSFLILINLLTSKNGNYWFVYPLIGWGIGLFLDAVNTFQWFPFLGKEWEDRKIKQFMNEERKRWNQ